MNKTLKNILQTLAGFIIGGIFLYFTLRNKNLDEIVASLKNADAFWMILSAVFLALTFVLRALRWEVILYSSNLHPKRTDIISAVFLGYFVNSFTPKLGELARCTSLKRSNAIKISKLLGTVVSERIYDIIILALGLIFFAIIEFDRLGDFFVKAGQSVGNLVIGKDFLLYIAIGGLFLVVLLYLFREKLRRFKIFDAIYNFVSGMYSTVIMTFRLKKFNRFAILTVLIWLSLVLMNYCYLMALPETENFSIYFAIVVLFVGGIGWAIPTPGGIGTTHFFILQLFIAYNLSETAGISFGILSNGLTFICTILFGIVTLIFIEYRIRKLDKSNSLSEDNNLQAD